MLEFFWTTEKTRLTVHDMENDEFFHLDNDHLSLIKQIERRIREQYPDVMNKLTELYGHEPAMAFARVNRFLKCNFSVHDNHPDIDDDWNFEFELVPCPLRGECNDAICEPKLTEVLSKRELEVVRLHCDGLTQQEIGDRLYISRLTAHNHITNVYQKLGFTGHANPDKLLINYAYKNKLV